MRVLIDCNRLTDDLFDKIVSIPAHENADVRTGMNIILDILIECIENAPKMIESEVENTNG
jgi:hypothetical protein